MRNSRSFVVMNGAVFLAFLLFVGFIAYFGELEAREFVLEREMPATGISVLSRFDAAVLHYKHAGDAFLRDGFLRRWIRDGHRDAPSLHCFLESIQNRYGLSGVRLEVSSTGTCYGTDSQVFGLSKKVRRQLQLTSAHHFGPPEVRIRWRSFLEFTSFGLFLSVYIRDTDGTILGLAEGKIDPKVFARIAANYELSRGTTVYVARDDGVLAYATDKTLVEQGRARMSTLWGADAVDTMRRERLSAQGVVIEPHGRFGPILWAGYVKAWNAYVVVERPDSSISDFGRRALVRAVLEGGGLAAVLFLLIVAAFSRFARRESLARVRMNRTCVRFQAVIAGQFRTSAAAEAKLDAIAGDLLRDVEEELPRRELVAVSRDMRETRVALRAALGSKGVPYKGVVELDSLCREAQLRTAPECIRADSSVVVAGDSPVRAQGVASLALLALTELLTTTLADSPPRSEILILVRGASDGPSIEIAVPQSQHVSDVDDLAAFLLDAMGASLSSEDLGGRGRIYTLSFPPAE